MKLAIQSEIYQFVSLFKQLNRYFRPFVRNWHKWSIFLLDYKVSVCESVFNIIQGGCKMVVKDNSHIQYEEIEKTEEFQHLKRRKYWFVFTIPLLFLLYYLTFIVLSAYAKPLMSSVVFGNFTFGYLYGISYYVVIWTLAFVYVWKSKQYDKEVEEIIEKYGPKEKGA